MSLKNLSDKTIVLSKKTAQLKASTKRGDTIIEVMFAIAIFSLVAVLSIAMMNAGVADAERALELVTARNELNAQAEALRFIHSSYVSEATLPPCGSVASSDEKCQQYQALWEDITSHTMRPANDNTGLNDNYTITDLFASCQEVYDSDDPTATYQELLSRNNAFIINTRELIAPRDSGVGLGEAYISTLNSSDRSLFTPALLNARVIFTRTGNRDDADADSSTVNLSDTNSLDYKSVARAEGIWVVAVRGDLDHNSGRPMFYDFHINSCWFGSNTRVPTVLDAVVRLYNPENIR